ncbi:MAG: hypothetical protein IKG83_05730 [Prevotella sp.]|nr:hypothetical protein [Prevotella sp.]
MKKSLFMLLALFLSIDLMAQTTLTRDVSNQPNKHVDVSAYTNLTRLNVIGATGVTLPPNKTSFTLDGTGSPDLVVNFAQQAMRTTLTTLTLINVNQADISSCEKLQTLICQGKGTEWGDGTDGHKGLICNTGATAGSWTLPALTSIRAQGSGVQKLDMTNAAANLKNLNICKSTMKELYIPNHTKFSPTGVQNTNSDTGFSLGYSTVDTLNYVVNVVNNVPTWKGVGEFDWNQLEKLDISGCNFTGDIIITGGDINYNASPLREFYAKGCSDITKLQIRNASLDTIDVVGCSKMTTFWVEQSRLKSVDFTGCNNIASFMARRNSLSGNMDFLTVPGNGRTEADIKKLRVIQVNGGSSGSIMKNEKGEEIAVFRDMFTNKIRSINTSYLGAKLENFGVADNLLQTFEIHEGLTGLTKLECDNNMLLTLDLTNLPATLTSGQWGWDMRGKQRMQVGFLNVEEVKGYAEDGSQDWVALPIPGGGGFEHLLDNTVKLFPSIEDAMKGTNEIAEEANPFMGTVEDFNKRENYEILCPTGHTGEHLFLHGQNEIKADAGGKIVDQDLYGKVLVYKYNTGFNGGKPKGNLDNHIEIRANIWPYILNINPIGKESGANTTGIDYYVATLCLDYDAVIPNGVTLHVPVGVKEGYRPKGQPESTYVMQFDMKEVGRPGMVLPKNTPVVVKSTQAAGLYSFQTAWDFDFKGWEDYRQLAIKKVVAEQRGCSPDDLYPILHGVDENNIIYKPEYDSIAHPDLWVGNDPEVAGYLEKNLMCGTQETMPCARKSILALGLQNAPGPDGVASLKVGFWRLNALSLPAHRCYILPEKLKEAMEEANLAGAKDGGLFYFGEYDTTAIRTIETEVQSPQKDDVVYDLQGRRITGKPVPGIYIVNGKKVVIK